MADDIWGDDTTLLGNFARGFRRLEQERLAKSKKPKPYITEPVYQGHRATEATNDVPLTC